MRRRCYVDGCDRRHYAKDYCQLHYYRWLRYGDASATQTFGPTPNGSVLLVERLGGLATYRQIDYWIRTGAVDLPHLSGLGSGHQRQFTDDEQLALIAYAEEWAELKARQRAMRDGSAFREILANLVPLEEAVPT